MLLFTANNSVQGICDSVGDLEYTAQNGNDIYSYSIEDNVLHCRWKRPSDSSYEKYPLPILSNEFHIWNGRSNNVTRKIQKAGLFLIAAIVLLLAEVPYSYPYVSIVLLILGVGHLYNDIHWALPATWTVVRNKEGVSVAYLLHSEKGSGNRETFENALSSKIIESKEIRNET